MEGALRCGPGPAEPLVMIIIITSKVMIIMIVISDYGEVEKVCDDNDSWRRLNCHGHFR